MFFRIVFALTASLYFISCGKDVSVTPPEAPPPAGFLYINSNPPGAEIFVNSKPTGRLTPDSLSWINGGKYDIRLRLPYFRDSLFSIDLPEKQKTNIFVDYTLDPAMRGSLNCKSTPDHAEIFLNGQPTNKYTPVLLTDVLPGMYSIRFRYDGCRDDSLKIAVKTKSVSEASVALQDTTIWLTYNKNNSPLPSNRLTCLALGWNGVIWIGTADKGLVSFDGARWKVYNTSNSNLPSNNVTSISIRIQPRSAALVYESIYIGTSGGVGVMNFYSENSTDFGNIDVYNKDNSPLPENYINSVSVDGANFAWVGTNKGLLAMPDNKMQMQTLDLSSVFGENIVTGVAAILPQYGWHGLWAATANKGAGFYNYLENKWELYNDKNGLPNNNVTAIAVADWYDAWLGCSATPDKPSLLVHRTYNAFKYFTLGSKYNFFQSIFARNDGIWVSTNEGLFSVSPAGVVKEFNTANSLLPSNELRGVTRDGEGRIWIATSYMGLAVYKPYLDK